MEYKRFCKTLKLEDDPELIEAYKKVHAPGAAWPEITQGMREVGIADTASGLETTFDNIIALGEKCRFKDCTHTGEAGCAVAEAVEKTPVLKPPHDSSVGGSNL